ncbi:MAG: HAMP domain-containing histidine kinase [Acidobacteriota bacterium]|nr:HAMP domain-containing histidine kinase [Acidobacteriota bacterium]
MVSGRRRSVIGFTILGVCLVAIAVALNVGWVVVSWQNGVLAVFGFIFFLLLIAGMVVYTVFMVREIRRNEQHDSFINAVTHELKTPVASIRLYLQTLQTRELDEAKRREFYQIMLDDSDRLLHTIEQVLRAGSTQSNFRRIDQTRVDLRALGEECVALGRTRFHLHDEALRFESGMSQPAIVVGDPDELKAGIWNLIDNAVKYSGENPQVRVTLDVTADGSRFALKVTDTGPGILPHELKRVFRRFYRIHGMSVRTKGSGLGLFIVRSVAKRHGGKAFAESAGAGLGSTFTLLLPRLTDPQ